MRNSATLITAPSSEPVTLQEAKSWARITDDEENALINTLIVAARQEAEKYLRSVLITQTWELTIDLCSGSLDDKLGDGVYQIAISELYGSLPNAISLPYAPIQSITSVKYYDLNNTEATYSSDNYTLDTAGGRLLLNYGAVWPSNMRRNASLKIRYVAGYGTGANVPAQIKIAMMGYVQSMYESRGVCESGADPLKTMQAALMPYRKMAI
jgi:hypothetical protein